MFFEVGTRGYKIEFRENYEVVFWTTAIESDPFVVAGEEVPTAARSTLISPHEAIMVYRNVVREIKKWVYTTKPPYFFWTTDSDASRTSLYDRLGEQVKVMGFTLVKSDVETYYAYRL